MKNRTGWPRCCLLALLFGLSFVVACNAQLPITASTASREPLYRQNRRRMRKEAATTGGPCKLEKVMFGDFINGYDGKWKPWKEAVDFAANMKRANPVAIMMAKLNNVPCADNLCCELDVFFRAGTSDWDVVRFWFNTIVYEWVQAIKVPPVYVLDLGGTIGTASIVFALLFPEAEILSIEPHFGNHHVACLNTEKYHNIHLENAGIWNTTGYLGITEDSKTGRYGEWGFRTELIQQETDNSIPAVTISGLLEKYNWPRFDMVKIDIEGAERVLFAPETDTSWVRDARLVFVEVHHVAGREETVANIKRVFEQEGFYMTSANDGEQLVFRKHHPWPTTAKTL